MSEFKFDVKDRIMVLKNERHPDYVKEKYGKALIVEKRFKSDNGDNFYKIKGIKNWGHEDELTKI